MPNIDEAKFCPRCNSPSVEYATLVLTVDSKASCEACGWKGMRADLLTSPVVHDMGSPDEVVQRFVSDFRNVIAKECGITFARWLSRWGFLPADAKGQAICLGRYLTAIARASITAVLDERKKIEKERVNVS